MQEKTDRNLALLKDKEKGMTYRELEKKYGISQNTITRIVSRYHIKQVIEQSK
jgi:Mor family transcriptional regulator